MEGDPTYFSGLPASSLPEESSSNDAKLESGEGPAGPEPGAAASMGPPAPAASMGFVTGYVETYDSNTTSESVQIMLFEFKSPMDAADFYVNSVENTDESKGLVASLVAGVPGGWVLDATKPDSRFYEHTVFASYGSVFMVVDYSSDILGPRPADLTTWAQQQFGRL